ncbi:phosphatase PAP2 family protein [Amycolatopsis marina]|uniref:phosphatase PAP2 family protein n=1 Tax=Amycolatopsis marina TaxID=490629 RepID=UPI001FE46EB7|nr:phosphatase PAP2 family protein [Amycolatopsis marina]
MVRSSSAVVAGLIVTLLLGIVYAGDRGPGPFDQSIMSRIEESTANQDTLLRLLVLPTEPIVLLPLLAVLALTALLGRGKRELALVLAGPAVAVALNTWLLKPAFGRYFDDHLAYPSGHAVSLVAVFTVLAVLARPGVATRLVVGIGVLLTLGAGVGMAALGYHYPTDVLGAAAFAIAVVLGIAAGLERLPGAEKSAR